MPGGELEPIGRAGPALAEVATEMSEIFARAGMSQPVACLRRPAAVAALRPSRSESPAATLIAAAVAGAVGLAAGAFVIHMPVAQVHAAAKLASQARPPPQAEPQPAPRAAPPITLAQAAPAAEAAPVGPAAKRAPAIAGKTAAVRRATFRVKLARLGGARPAEARPVVRLPVPVAQPASCEQDAEGDDCRRAVVEADRHLRAVYESAFRRGVSRSTLVDYRDRWADLRDQQTGDPTRLIESYGALAYDLGRESPDPDDDDDAPAPRGRSGLKALADLLLPWR
jgi:Meckel syndrome type 1 protein